jgi:hypothetical protein
MSSKNTSIIRVIEDYLDGHRRRYRCGECLGRSLHVEPSEIADAIKKLGERDGLVLVEQGECGECLERKTCLIMH